MKIGLKYHWKPAQEFTKHIKILIKKETDSKPVQQARICQIKLLKQRWNLLATRSKFRCSKKLTFLCTEVGTQVMILARNSNNCSFSSRKRCKNSTFSLPNYKMTIDTFKSAKNWSGVAYFKSYSWFSKATQWYNGVECSTLRFA